MNSFSNKLKIFNDPIYGFVSIPYEIIYDLIDHPWFQRLRRIKQLGLTNLVYPGALHTRFHHAMGAMHLMGQAIEVLRSKNHTITEEEAKGVTIAILLHDIGHGPFSHALEHSIVNNINHEDISELLMSRLNEEFNGELSLAIRIFQNKYKKKFLHQLVSSQLDMDRLDYLKRDSFFTGVSEGVVSSDRIIKMLNVVNDELAIEAKGIYSIEKFIIARRLMYWQVYLHKTVLSAENLLVNILTRAKDLAEKNVELFCTPQLRLFLYNKYSKADFINDRSLLETFAKLDDYDIMASIKVWTDHADLVLSMLCRQMVDRELFKVELQKNPFKEDKIQPIRKEIKKRYKLTDKETEYFVLTGTVANDAYRADKIRINILSKDGSYCDITEASDQLNVDVLAKTVKKYYLCYPK
ncbi:MAG: superfamily phosphohydrolase [Bacteroidetes bacterium]|jgi:HD superfamily phosphohydrolase|nr:superfamily phosphohydrolase [Bacteroidota bacterium]